jgi:nucleosome-remodeling factor subunit BPTF
MIKHFIDWQIIKDFIDWQMIKDFIDWQIIKECDCFPGTYMFKLGMENGFKSYVNQYSTNIGALNKLQRNEERDKKRHLSHKFSLTQASEFKWIGSLYGK